MTELIDKVLENKYFKYILYTVFLLMFAFSRSFMGVYIFGFRVGEIAMGFSAIFLIISILFYKKFNFFESKNRKVLIFLMYLNFIVIFLNTILQNQSVSLYSFRASSYFWTLGYFFFGYLFFKSNIISEKFFYVGYLLLIHIYFYSVLGVPEFIVNFILSISDKFEPHKGSDILVMFISILFISNRLYRNKRKSLEYFIVICAAYAPLLMIKSRASFISFIIYFLFEIIYFKSDIFPYLKRNLVLVLLSTYLLLQSIYLISGSGFVKANSIDVNIEYVVTYRSDPDNEKFRLFYIQYDDLGSKTTRIFSSDNNLNWRLQIWQDVLYDLRFKKQLVTGYGYSEKIPAMEDETRKGQDGLNENVHNFIVNLIARGGLVTLFLFLIFYYFLIKTNFQATNSFYLISYVLPIFFNSLFDVAMENSHFPLIFYFCIGMLFHKNRLFENY